MSITKETSLWCDVGGPTCRIHAGDPTQMNARDVRRAAKTQGWQRYNGIDSCPECVVYNRQLTAALATTEGVPHG